MHTLTYLGLSFLNPGVRQIGFSGEGDERQYTVAKLLIHAWTAQEVFQECNNPPDQDASPYMREASGMSEEERQNLPRSGDTRTIHTPWRDQLYYIWNHVFFDVGNFMAGMYGTGRFNPPNTEVFGIEFPTTSPANISEDGGKSDSASTKVWDDVATLLIPAYLAPGVNLRVERVERDEGNDAICDSGKFSHDNRYIALYAKKGVELRFYVEGDYDRSMDGLAAVMVYGKLSSESLEGNGDGHDFEDEEDDDCEDKE